MKPSPVVGIHVRGIIGFAVGKNQGHSLEDGCGAVHPFARRDEYHYDSTDLEHHFVNRGHWLACPNEITARHPFLIFCSPSFGGIGDRRTGAKHPYRNHARRITNRRTRVIHSELAHPY
jgi:hypothetical protein